MSHPLRNFFNDPFNLTLGVKVEPANKPVKVTLCPKEVSPGLFEGPDGKLSFDPHRAAVVKVLKAGDVTQLTEHDRQLALGQDAAAAAARRDQGDRGRAEGAPSGPSEPPVQAHAVGHGEADRAAEDGGVRPRVGRQDRRVRLRRAVPPEGRQEAPDVMRR